MRVLILALAVVALAGCVPSAPDSPTPTTTVTTSPSPSPSPSPSQTPTPTPSPTVFASFPATLPTEDPVTAAVIAGWQEYWRVYEKFAADPGGFKDFAELSSVATPDEEALLVERLNRLKARNVILVGPQQFRAVEVSGLTTTSTGTRQATIAYCADNSARERRDAITGEPIVVDVAPTFNEQALMEEDEAGSWRVAEVSNQEAKC